ncbi:MAG: Mur ligase family protein [Bifidobacteriaceae bacterium]|jgi:UDP-N-acetylmuramoyl-L-alanyl-D-glutamate--2,6-diaminopimelate ligase|nr:Mur ligase family protein [Bifidobacteriaceae bacterium]MCI1914204.1 Mur ligase family protein [Bifidobacteriaceae bacterium]
MHLRTAFDVLVSHGLLREVITGTQWSLDPEALSDLTFDAVSYDTRAITPTTLLFCKGRFSARYLSAANDNGLKCYVSESEYSEATNATGLIVNDIHQAMALLSAQFYGNPQNEITLVGITGTKGKTTTAYLTHAVLNAATHGKTALMSSEQTILDGTHPFESELTTPESLDAFRMMRQALDAGMTHLVMEVSSQAYKLNRVYGITFDVGAFLNISPDHISPIEHPTFEDYFYCKRRLIENSRRVVLNADLDATAFLTQTAALHHVPTTYFGLELQGASTPQHIPYPPQALCSQLPDATMNLLLKSSEPGTSDTQATADLGPLHLHMDGAVNYANAAAAAAIALAVGVEVNDAQAFRAMESVVVPGRMEKFEGSGIVAYADFAHNFDSVKTLLDFVDATYPHAATILVTGSAGDKAFDRRADIVHAAQDRVCELILTEDDPGNEDPRAIAEQMRAAVTNPDLPVSIVIPRARAVEQAITDLKKRPETSKILLAIGKGEEKWMKTADGHSPYEGDDHVITRMLQEK